MAILKFKNELGGWDDIPAIRGRDGVIQYQAGTGITIEGNVISAIQQDLTNYYTKSEVNGLIEAIETVSLDVEQTLPATGEPNVIYLVPSSDPSTQNAMDEYIYVNNAWEKIGSTAVDLSNYVTKTEVPVFLAWDGSTGTTTAVKEFFQQVVDAHAEGKDVFVVGRKANSNLIGELIYILRKNDTVQISSPNNYYQMLGTATASVSQNSYNHSTFDLTETNINIYGQLSNGRFVVNNVITSEAGYQLDYLDIQHVYNAAYIPTHDYNPATKKYVDDSIAAIPSGSSVPYYEVTDSNLESTEAKQKWGAIFTDAYAKGIVHPILRITPDANAQSTLTRDVIFHRSPHNLMQKPSFMFFFALQTSATNRHSDNRLDNICISQLAFNMTWSGDVCTVTSAVFYPGSFDVLSTDNTAAYTPTSDYNPATKKYVDDITGALTNLATTDKTSLVNAINEVLAGSGGDSEAVKVLYLDDYSSSSNALDMSKFETGLYIILRKREGNTMYMKPRASASARGLQNATGFNNLTLLLYSNQLPETYDSNARGLTIFQLNPNSFGYWVYTDYNTYFDAAWNSVVESVSVANNQTITGTKNFSTLPVSSVTPTFNNQLVNKQYVDDKLSTLTGYDASKTQVLKNINGTLTWVDE